MNSEAELWAEDSLDEPLADQISSPPVRSLRRRLRWGVGIGLLLVLMLMAVLAARLGDDQQLAASPLIGQTIPDLDLVSLETGDPLPWTTSSDQIRVINFFASWCLQCLEEHADLVSTADAFADSGIHIIQIVYQDEPDRISNWLAEEGTSPHITYATDPGSRAAISLGVFGIPETFFVNPAGIVVGKITGQSDAFLLGDTIDKIRAGIDPGEQYVSETQQSPTS